MKEVKIMRSLLKPDDVGTMEYRAIYELLCGVLSDCPKSEQPGLCEAILQEFISSAQGMLAIIRRHGCDAESNGDGASIG